MEPTPDEDLEEPSQPFKLERLRALMKDRESLAQRLLQLDFDIWKLEEYFRAGGRG